MSAEEGGRRRDAAPATYLEEMPKEFCFPEEGLDLQDPKLKKILIWNSVRSFMIIFHSYPKVNVF